MNLKKIEEVLNSHKLCHGLGNKESMCSIAAMNLALYGKLTDDIPECMSPVAGKFIITLQDRMPLELINSKEWKAALPLVAGTGRDHEAEILQLIVDWMWCDVLPTLQQVANTHGFGKEWRVMCEMKTDIAACTAADSAYAAGAGAASFAASARGASFAASARGASFAARAARAARAAGAASFAASARGASFAARAARAARAAGAASFAHYSINFWDEVNPANLLNKISLINKGDKK